MCNFLFFIFWKGYEKANLSTQIVGIGDFCPQKKLGKFFFFKF